MKINNHEVTKSYYAIENLDVVYFLLLRCFVIKITAFSYESLAVIDV